MKSIGSNAFAGNPNLVHIYFGEGIEELQASACRNCSALESVSFPSTLRYLYSAFQDCRLITRLKFPANLEYLGVNWLYGMIGLTGTIDIPAKTVEINQTAISSPNITAFNISPNNPNYKSVDGCLLSKDGKELCMVPTSSEWLSDYTTPEGVTSIRSSTFTLNSSLITLTFREGVVSATGSIGSCPNLTQVNLPSTLTTNPFMGYASLSNLSVITVSEKSQTFASVDGELFSKDMVRLVRYPPDKRAAYIVPSTTKVLGSGSFSSGRVQSLTLNEGLISIQSNALRGVIKVSVSALNVLRIPNTVSSVDGGLFGSNWSGFEVDSNHPYFSTDGSVLYNKDRTIALVYTCDTSAPTDQKVTLPATVETLGAGFSYSNRPLVKLDLSQTKITTLPSYTWFSSVNDGVERTLLLPNTLTRINRDSIRIATAKSLTIPVSVTTIESGAIGLDNAEEIVFADPGQMGSDGVKVFNLTTFNSIFWVISTRCIVKGYKGTGGVLSPAEQIARQYTLKFKELTD